MKRCDWCYVDNLYMQYHDEEWGKPVFNDRRLFEMLILEMFQAGLSWHTILKKRKNFQDAYHLLFQLWPVATTKRSPSLKALTSSRWAANG